MVKLCLCRCSTGLVQYKAEILWSKPSFSNFSLTLWGESSHEFWKPFFLFLLQLFSVVWMICLRIFTLMAVFVLLYQLPSILQTLILWITDFPYKIWTNGNSPNHHLDSDVHRTQWSNLLLHLSHLHPRVPHNHRKKKKNPTSLELPRPTGTQ